SCWKKGGSSRKARTPPSSTNEVSTTISTRCAQWNPSLLDRGEVHVPAHCVAHRREQGDFGWRIRVKRAVRKGGRNFPAIGRAFLVLFGLVRLGHLALDHLATLLKRRAGTFGEVRGIAAK